MTRTAGDALTVLVADDEALARRRLVRLLGAMPDVTVAGECTDGKEVLARVAEDDIDVILLDVAMPGLSGLEALQLLSPDGPLVIFCTAHPDHAVAAFDEGAVDYVLKPVDAARLRKALDRARAARGRGRDAAPAPAPTPATGGTAPTLARLALPTREGVILVDPETVSHAVIDGELVTVHAAQGAYFCDTPLGELERQLPEGRFMRVHRRAVVNLALVARLEPLPTGGYVAHMTSGATVEVSRQAARDLRRLLGLR